MANFKVIWEIDIEDVADAHAAAVRALEIQRNPESTAVAFTVEQRGALTAEQLLTGAYRTDIDLLEESDDTEAGE